MGGNVSKGSRSRNKKQNSRDQISRTNNCNLPYKAYGAEILVEKFLDHKPLPTVKQCSIVPQATETEEGKENEYGPWVKRVQTPKYEVNTDVEFVIQETVLHSKWDKRNVTNELEQKTSDGSKITEVGGRNAAVGCWNHVGVTYPETSKNHYDVIDDNIVEPLVRDKDETEVQHIRSEGLTHQMNQNLDFEEMVNIFKPLMIQNLIVRDVLPYLSFLETHDDLYSIEPTVTRRQAVVYLLRDIKNSKHVGKWHAFIEALEKTNYHYIVLNIRGYKFITVHYQTDYLKTLTPKISKMMNAMELLPILYRRDVIGDNDKEEIEREDRNKGEIAAAVMLLDRIPRKHPHWYLEFISALNTIGRDDIAADLEIPEVMKKRCEQPTETESRQQRNSLNNTADTENTTKGTIQPCQLPGVIGKTDNEYYSEEDEPYEVYQDQYIHNPSVMDANENDTEENDHQYSLPPPPPSVFNQAPQRLRLPPTSSLSSRPRLPLPPIPITKAEMSSDTINVIAQRPHLPSCRPYKCICPPPPKPPVPRRQPILETTFEGHFSDDMYGSVHNVEPPIPLPSSRPLQKRTTVDGQSKYIYETYASSENLPTMQSRYNDTSAHQELEDEIEKLQREKYSLNRELELMTTKDELKGNINEGLRKKRQLQRSLRNKEKQTEALKAALADDNIEDDYIPSSARRLGLLTAARDIKTKVPFTWPEQSAASNVLEDATFLGPNSVVKIYNTNGLSRVKIPANSYNDSAFYSDYSPMTE